MDALAEMQALYREALDATRDQRRQIEEDLRFTDPSDPQQWDDDVKRARETDPGGARPCLVHDQIGQYISNVAGQFEQRPPAIHTIPVGNGADKRVSESLDGLIRHIEHASRAQAHYARALTSAARCGVGYLTIEPSYVDRALNWQEPRIGSEGDPLRVVLDPWSVELDGSDATFGHILTPYSHREFERKFGKKDKVSFGTSEQSQSKDDRESIIVSKNWRIETVTRNMLVVDVDGELSTMTEDEYWQRYTDEMSRPAVRRTYPDKVRRVLWSVASGAEMLVPEREFPADGIGIVPLYGYVGWSDGRMTYCGMGRRARVPQQSYNFHISEIRAHIQDAPKSPWLVPVRAIDDGLKLLWDKASVERRAYLPYHDMDESGNPVSAPQRMQLAVNLQNLSAGAAQAQADIQASLGMYQASLGAPSNETSGVAIESRKQQGEASTSHFVSHAAAAIGQIGRLCVDMIPRLIDTKRRARILGIDMTPGDIVIDPGLPRAVQEMEGGVLINPGAGTYDVRVVVGASFSTQRQQAQAAYTEMMRANPNLTPAIAPLWAQSMDVPHADKLAQVLTAVAPPEVQAILKPADNQPTSSQLLAQVEQMKQALQEALSVAEETQQECDQLRAQAEQAQAELEDEKRRTEIQMFDAETKRMSVIKDAQADQVSAIQEARQAAAEVVQQMLSGLQLPQSDPMESEPEEPEEPEKEKPESPPQPIVVNVQVDARQPVSTSKQVMIQRMPDGSLAGTVVPTEEM